MLACDLALKASQNDSIETQASERTPPVTDSNVGWLPLPRGMAYLWGYTIHADLHEAEP